MNEIHSIPAYFFTSTLLPTPNQGIRESYTNDQTDPGGQKGSFRHYLTIRQTLCLKHADAFNPSQLVTVKSLIH